MPATALPVYGTATCAGYVVVARASNRLTGVNYEAFDDLNEAVDCYTAYEDGEYKNTRPVGIFPCDSSGMPSGPKLDAHYITRLVRETRAA